jgi:putative membrane protein
VPKPSYRATLLLLFAAWWALLAWKPWYRDDWLVENLLTVAFVGLLIATRDRFRLSKLSYTLIAIFLALHTLGSHYTYAKVPYEAWSARLGFSLDALFGFDRNQYDRLVHFLFGLLLVYPAREVFVRVVAVRGFWSYWLPVDVVMSFSMLYELVEWAVAEVLGGDLGAAYLGTQGDIWDAQKDMSLASLGALLGMGAVVAVNRRMQRDLASEFAESFRVKDPRPLGEERVGRYARKR